MVTLQFSTEHAFDSALIRWVTWSDWSHVDFCLPDGRLLGARLDGGVQIRPSDYAKFARRYQLTIPDAPDAVLEYALSQVGKPYDWKGILNFGLHRNWRDDSAWFCSELGTHSFEEGRYPRFPKLDCRRVSPDKLFTVLMAILSGEGYPDGYCESCGTTHA